MSCATDECTPHAEKLLMKLAARKVGRQLLLNIYTAAACHQERKFDADNCGLGTRIFDNPQTRAGVIWLKMEYESLFKSMELRIIHWFKAFGNLKK